MAKSKKLRIVPKKITAKIVNEVAFKEVVSEEELEIAFLTVIGLPDRSEDYDMFVIFKRDGIYYYSWRYWLSYSYSLRYLETVWQPVPLTRADVKRFKRRGLIVWDYSMYRTLQDQLNYIVKKIEGEFDEW